MNKKKIITLALVAIISVVAIAGASLAYFTDKDAKDNVFTTGKVDITLDEDFDENNNLLLPGTVSRNNLKKRVSISVEEGSVPAYVWYEWLIPAALDNIESAGGNILHVNSAGSTWDKYRENEGYWADDQTEALPLEKTWDHEPAFAGTNGFLGTETIDGVVYNKYAVLYHGIVNPGEETSIGMAQVYMDKHIDTDANGNYTYKGNAIDFDFSKDIHLIVRAYGIQASGFADVYAAYAAYNEQYPNN